MAISPEVCAEAAIGSLVSEDVVSGQRQSSRHRVQYEHFGFNSSQRLCRRLQRRQPDFLFKLPLRIFDANASRDSDSMDIYMPRRLDHMLIPLDNAALVLR